MRDRRFAPVVHERRPTQRSDAGFLPGTGAPAGLGQPGMSPARKR